MSEEFEEEFSVSLAQTIERHLAEAEQSKSSGNPNWWKIHEACMLALGSAQDVLVRNMEAGKVNFEIGGFLQSVVLANIAQPGKIFLE